MKNPKNIEIFNNIVTYYISLQGLQGLALTNNSPFGIYFAKIAMDGNISTLLTGESEIMVASVPNNLLHMIIQDGFELYRKIDNINSLINDEMKAQVVFQLGGEDVFEEFVSNSIKIYKKSFYELLVNYNSNREDYNDVKLIVLSTKLDECITTEEYLEAASVRDILKEFKEKYDL